MEEEQVSSATPMDDANFEATWQAASSGNATDSPGQESSDGANTPVTGQDTSQADTPAVASQPASLPSAQTDTPATQAPTWTAEQVEAWQQKARHFDSVQGNWGAIQQRWEAEKVAPIQAKLQEREREREAIRDFYIKQQAPHVQESMRRQFQEEAQGESQQLARMQQTQAIQQAQQQINQKEQYLAYQQQEMVRTNILGSIDGFTADFAKEIGIPVNELRDYIEANGLRDRMKNSPIQQIGPILKQVEDYASFRATQIARENAAKATQAGKYRTEGGEGSGGQGKADNITKMNDDAFSTLWANALAGKAS